MMHSNLLAVVFALLSALTVAWGTILRHQVAEQTSGDRDNAHGTPVFSAVARPKWWAGVFCALAAYGLQIIALGFGTLLVVQPILVLSLMFTLPLAARFDGRRVSRPEMAWATLLTVAVGVVVVWGRPLPGSDFPTLSRWMVTLGVGVVVLVGLMWLATRLRLRTRALVLGAVTGAIMGYLAVLSKSVVNIFYQEGAAGLLTSWEAYGLVACAVIGTLVQQASFNAGALKNSLPAMTITEPIVAFVLGYLVLGERFQVEGSQWLIMAGALVVMVASTVILSRRGVE
ncbi:DMT family transporter [Corynebacterium sp.]|uniref:DMT family transporter n=1 Tax=Corynebacterium sp. TaxID=1720 RepID=UPI0025BCFB36|nr:DMT family transporter [Corynebacterium sp.]